MSYTHRENDYFETVELWAAKWFMCNCGAHCYMEYDTNHGDSLDFHCGACGAYYKKSIRIPEDSVISCELFNVVEFDDTLI